MFKVIAQIIALLALLAAGCTQPEVPQDRFYRPQVTPPAAALAAPKLPGVLEVPRFSAEGLMAGRPIVFSDAADPVRVEAYYYHFWVEPPATMLRDALVGYLRAAGVAGRVVTPDLQLDPDFVLTGKIKRIEQVRGASPRVVVALDLALNRRSDDRLLMLRTYEVERTPVDNSVSAAVSAMSEALQTIFERAVADLPAA